MVILEDCTMIQCFYFLVKNVKIYSIKYNTKTLKNLPIFLQMNPPINPPILKKRYFLWLYMKNIFFVSLNYIFKIMTFFDIGRFIGTFVGIFIGRFFTVYLSIVIFIFL